MPHIVYEDANLRVMFAPGQSAHLLVTFGDAEKLAEGTKFFADRVALTHRLTAIGFMAKAANWYPPASMAAALPDITPTLMSFSKRLVFGSSMGGYAAIKYSRLLGATHVVAYCPQWSIDPQDCGDNPSGYEACFTPNMAGMAIAPSDMAGSIYQFFDPAHAVDAFHAGMIQRLNPAVRACHVYYAAHHLVPVLRGATLTRNLWDAVQAGEHARIYALINSVRRENPLRRQHLLEAAAGRHPYLTARTVNALRSRNTLNVLQPLAIYLRLCRAFVRRADYESAGAVLPILAPFLSAARLRAIWYQLQLFQSGATALPCGLATCHATRLFYNAFLGVLFHAQAPLSVHDKVGIFPVEATKDGVRCLAVKLGGAHLACILAEDGHVDLVPAEASDPSGLLRVSGSDTLIVMIGERYLCAEPDGRVAYDRTQLGPWEQFK
jgi:hypothetical protein